MKRPNNQGRTFFQQKWTAKQVTRRYHGEHLTKRQWQNIFKHSLKSIIPMNTKDLAESDGSEYAAGRGSGLTAATEGEERRQKRPVPYMAQVYAPMERRLDIAIFRAMFASSALQARQFVIHGWVKVNGKKVRDGRGGGGWGGGGAVWLMELADATPPVHAQPGRHV